MTTTTEAASNKIYKREVKKESKERNAICIANEPSNSNSMMTHPIYIHMCVCIPFMKQSSALPWHVRARTIYQYIYYTSECHKMWTHSVVFRLAYTSHTHTCCAHKQRHTQANPHPRWKSEWTKKCTHTKPENNRDATMSTWKSVIHDNKQRKCENKNVLMDVFLYAAPRTHTYPYLLFVNAAKLCQVYWKLPLPLPLSLPLFAAVLVKRYLFFCLFVWIMCRNFSENKCALSS